MLTTADDENRLSVSQRSDPPSGASVWLRSAGFLIGHGRSRYVFAPGGHVGPHLIMKGEGMLRWAGQERRLTKGDMFCALPGLDTEHFEDPAHPWQYAWLEVVGPGALDFAAGCGFATDMPMRRPEHAGPVAASMRALREALAPPEASPYRVLELLYRFADACDAPVMSRETEEMSGHEVLVMRAKSVVASGLHTGINVNQLVTALA